MLTDHARCTGDGRGARGLHRGEGWTPCNAGLGLRRSDAASDGERDTAYGVDGARGSAPDGVLLRA